MAFRFVHAADIHLDSPLRSLALRNPELSELVGNATRRAFVRIIDLCLDEQVDALLIAGDLYDGDQTSMKTARFIADQFHRLSQAGIAIFIIRGNHDALSKITRELVFPDSVRVFGAKAECVEITRPAGSPPIVIHGLSFKDPHAPESLLMRYRPPVEGAVNIGLMHTSLDGALGHDLYAPCSVADLQASGFRYWALGHIHKRAVHEGTCTVVMPGMPQGRDINEGGVKSATLVTIDDDRGIHIEERATTIAEFGRVIADVTGLTEWRDLSTSISAALKVARDRTGSEHLVARLQFTGATPLAWRMLRDTDLLRTQAEERAALLSGCWIEKIEIAARVPETKSVTALDPLGELRRLMRDDILCGEAFGSEMLEIAEELRGQLPPESRALLGLDEAGLKSMLERLAQDGADEVLARLQPDDRGEQA